HGPGTDGDVARRPPAAHRAGHRGRGEGARGRARPTGRGPVPPARLRRHRPRITRVRPGPHVGRRPFVVGGGAGGPRPDGGTGAGGTSPRPRPRLPGRGREGALRLRSGARGPGAWIPGGRGTGGPARRRVLPSGRDGRGRP